jgi:probable rRNA maturation factor
MKVTNRLNLSVQYACNTAGLPSRTQVRQWARAALAGGGQITVRYVEAEEGQALNKDYRGKDYATNVLSFVYENEPLTVGDLVICAPVVAHEAAEQARTPEAHHAHLVVHGILHLQGYDHETGEEDARIMEAREREILAGLGYPDPYSEES